MAATREELDALGNRVDQVLTQIQEQDNMFDDTGRKLQLCIPICTHLRHKAALECCRDVLTEGVAPPPAPHRVLAVTICPSRCELYPTSAVRAAGLGWYGC